MSKFKHNLTQGTFERMALVHPNIKTPRDLIENQLEQMDDRNPQSIIKLEEISEYWKKKNPYEINIMEPKTNTIKSCDYPDIKSELESYNSGKSPMPQLPEISENMYPKLSQHFRTLPERKIEESFKLVKAFHILKSYYSTHNITYISYSDFLNHANIIYHGYHNKQMQTELKILQSYSDEIKMHLVNPSGTFRTFELFQQVLVTNYFKEEYSFYPKLSPDAGDLIVRNNSLKSYAVGELKSGSLPQNSIITLFQKMGSKYAWLKHLHIYMDGDKNYIEQTIKDAKLEIPENFQLHFINTEKVFSGLYEVKNPIDIQFDFYYTQYMEIYDYMEHQKLLGNGKKPVKIFLDKILQESNALDSNKKINLMKLYSHFLSRYDLDWLDNIKNVHSKSGDINLDDVSDNN